MRKVNFNNIDNLEIPDSWAEKALLLPSAIDEKKGVVIPQFYRKLAFVACFVAVCALSVTLFTFTRKGVILPVEYPSVSVTEQTQHSTSGIQPSTETQAESVSEPSDSTASPTETNTEPTSDSTEIEPSEDDSTSSNSNSVTKPSKPTVKPTVKPTQPPTQPPTTESTTYPEDGDSPAVEGGYLCEAVVDANLLLSDGVVYCSVEKPDYQVDAVPPQYPASVQILSNGKAYLTFNSLISESVCTTGVYEYTFYNSDGDVIYRDTIYIHVN